MTNKKIKWPDLSAYGIEINAVKTALNQKIYCITGMVDGKRMPLTGDVFEDNLKVIGFRKINGLYWKPAGTGFKGIVKAFPKVTSKAVSRDDIVISDPKWIRSYANKFWNVGKNHKGEDVYIDFNGIRSVLSDDGQFHSENPPVKPNPDFLRANEDGKLNAEALSLCADGFLYMAEQHSVSMDDFIAFASSVVGTKINENSKESEVVLNAIFERLSDRIKGIIDSENSDKGAFDYAERIAENIKELDIGLRPVAPVLSASMSLSNNGIDVHFVKKDKDVQAIIKHAGKKALAICMSSDCEAPTANSRTALLSMSDKLGNDRIALFNIDGIADKTAYSYADLWEWRSSVVRVLNPDIEKIEDVNELQVRYDPSSELNSPRAVCIPKNMASPVAKALKDLSDKHGNIDDFVMSKLQMTPEQIDKAFTAAQVDAIALAVSRFDKGEGFILGDQTGFGKGRVMAAMIRYSILKGLKPVFITEKANLFSDMVARDLKAIHSLDMVKPLILNADAKNGSIRDDDGKILFSVTKQNADRKAFIKDGDMGDYNLLLATYSQFNREKSVKTDALTAMLTEGGSVLMDEAHNAAGDSNVGTNIKSALEISGAPVMYASATAIKSIHNIDVYSRNMGNIPYSSQELLEAARHGGEHLLQVLNTMFANDGGIIRREYSLDDVEFSRKDPDAETVERNIRLSSAASVLMQRMNKLSAKCFSYVKDIEESISGDNSLAVHYTNFTSRLYNLNRQLMLSLRVDDLVQSAIDDVSNNRKPVIVLDHTMDSITKDIVSDMEPDEDGKYVLDRHISMMDAMLRTIDKLIEYKKKKFIGRGKSESEYVRIEDKKIIAEYQAIRKEVQATDELTEMSLNVFDIIHNTLNAHNITTSEISNRSMRTYIDDDGRQIVETMPTLDRNLEKDRFNHGEADAILLSGAGSTGLSIHSCSSFNDQRQRSMHIGQPSANIVPFIQMLGRVNRLGQVNNPLVTFHTSGLIGEKRELVGLGCKARELMASSTANRNSRIDILIGDEQDMINDIGYKALIEYYNEYPEVAKQLGINYESMTKKVENGIIEASDVVRKTLSRTSMLIHGPSSIDDIDTSDIKSEYIGTAAHLYACMSENFNAILSDMEAAGENPFNVNEYDWNYKTVRKALFSGVELQEYDSPFDEPVYVEDIEYTEVVSPMRWDKIIELANAGKERFDTASRKAFDGKTISEALKERKTGILNNIYTMRHDKSLTKAALYDVISTKGGDGNKLLYNTHQNIKAIEDTLKLCKPGFIVRLNDVRGDGEPIEAVVLKLDIPSKPEHIHRPGDYKLHIAVPGHDKPLVLSLSAFRSDLYNGENMGGYELDESHIAPRFKKKNREVLDIMKGMFNDMPEGEVKRSRTILTGNLLAAAMEGLGKLTVITDGHGNRNTTFMLPKSINFDNIVRKTTLVRQPALISELLESDIVDRISNVKDGEKFNPDTHICILKRNGYYILGVPASSRGTNYFGDNARAMSLQHKMVPQTEDGHAFVFKDGSKTAWAKVLPENIKDVVEDVIPLSGGMTVKSESIERVKALSSDAVLTV